MSISVNDKNLGHVSAYAYAKSKGYTGTEEEFAELMASYATVAEAAAASASAAEGSATAAAGSATAAAGSASTANTKAEEASASATAAAVSATAAAGSASTANTKAGEASAFSTAAEGSATAAAGSATAAAVSAMNANTAKTAAQTAKTGAETAHTAAAVSATAAAGSASTANTEALKSEGYAIGKQNGTDVASGSPYYQNNAKYYAAQAAGSASTANTKAGEASAFSTDAAGSATAAAVSATAAATSETNAAGSATAAAGSASTASTAATSAINAKTAAEAAQTAAETAQGKAETAQGKAEDAQSAAETAAQSVSASAAQIAKNASDIERLNAGVDVLFDFHKTSLTWGEIVALIESGEMSEIFPVASQIKDTWKNTSDTSVEFPWDVVHYSANGDTWLKLHYAAPEAVQFDAPEAIYYFDGTEAAGTYHIEIGSAYGTGWVVGHSIQLTLTAAPDEGDQLVIDCGEDRNNDPAAGRSWNVYDAGGTTVKQSGTTSEGTDGISLGTIGNVNAVRTNGRLCAICRVVYGYGRWSQSAVRQYFNSAEINWWTMKNPWDRPPAQASTIRGFLYGFSQDFLDHLEETEVVTALSTKEGFAEATETTMDKIFLPSFEQMYIYPQLAGVEGESWDYYKDLAAEAGLSEKFKRSKGYSVLTAYDASNTSSAVKAFLRSTDIYDTSYLFIWYLSGGVYWQPACSSYMGCPACKFKKSTQS